MVRWRRYFGQYQSCSTAPSREVLRKERYEIRKPETAATLAPIPQKWIPVLRTRCALGYYLAAFSTNVEFGSGLPPARLRYCWTTGGDAVDCAAPCRAGAALRAGFFGGAGFVVAVGAASTGPPPRAAANRR